MSLLYLIRHAATVQIPDVPAARWPLSSEGELAARVLAGRRFWPEIHCLVTSSEQKAIATAAPAAELWRLDVERRSIFDEVRREGYVADYESRVRAFFEEPTVSRDGWETARSAKERAVGGLAALLAEYPVENIAVVGHGLLWALLRSHLLGEKNIGLAAWRGIWMPDVSVWTREVGVWRLLQDFEGIRRLHR